jgi:hypothetical protein
VISTIVRKNPREAEAWNRFSRTHPSLQALHPEHRVESSKMAYSIVIAAPQRGEEEIGRSPRL